MNTGMPLTLARAMASMAPPSSCVHKILAAPTPEAIDRAMLADKRVDGHQQRLEATALCLQMQRQHLLGDVL